ncbi:MAG: DUF438 domain-containing protein [Thermoguttaceae bacterium]|nr:DUF438 domain-containing protein [Thermoguttaceae bacterium]MDW8077711.1 DUF438 domain-containing protein [Thermoguttaceae bacterium]
MSEPLGRQSSKAELMKEILRGLREHGSVEEARRKFREVVGSADPHEVVAIEQQLLAEGVSVAELCQVCDLHSQVVQEVLPPQRPQFPAGHPAETFQRENQAILQLVEEIARQADSWLSVDNPEKEKAVCLTILEKLHQLFDVDKHYKRKEYCLFPYLERHGITGPSQVMWAKDDEIRQKLNLVSSQLAAACTHLDSVRKRELVGLVKEVLAHVVEMVNKEENILLPMAARILSEQEWEEIWQLAPQYGWCLVEPGNDYQPRKLAQQTTGTASNEAIQLPTGRLTYEQLLGIFRTLPVDLTFVDDNDRVAYFSDGAERIFDRNVAILGRKVQHCHPPKSIAVVEQILNDFRSGRRNVAEFWIQFRGKFVHIRYFAVRDEKGRYLGTLEVTQDISRIRTLEGERRLLQYDV